MTDDSGNENSLSEEEEYIDDECELDDTTLSV